MERLFLFVYRYRAFFTFLVLESFCAWLIVENNQYQGSQFFNSSASLVASINSFSHSTREYFSLQEMNRMLAEENVNLRKKLDQNQNLNSLSNREVTDSAMINRFDFVSAKVVNNSVHRFTNFLTINKGEEEGVAPGMAVISTEGVIGKVKAVSGHYGVVTSILNINVMVSALLKRTGNFGTIHWDARTPDIVMFDYIPRHVKPELGDTVVSSGYNAIFPEGILIGTIQKIKLSDEALFYELSVKLTQDFRKLSYVVVVKSNLKPEIDSLEQTMEGLNR